MKKTLALLLTACFLLVGCGEEQDNGPAKATQDFCAKMTQLDISGAADLIEPDQRAELNLDELGLDDPEIAPVLEAMKAFTSQNTCTVKSSTVDGDTATVTVSVNYIDLSGKMEDLLNNATTAAVAKALKADDPAALTQDEITQMVCDALAEQATSTTWTKSNAEFTVDLVKIDGQWYLTTADEKLLYSLISYFGQ